MSALWDSLISAGAGLLGAVLGAVIGVIGALRASRQASQQASQIAIEQVRFAVRYERKAQVMATAYDKVGIARDKLDLLTSLSDAERARFRPSIDAYWESSADTKAYLDRNAVWNDPQVDQALRDVLQQCNQSSVQFQDVVSKDPSTTEFENGKKDLAVSIKGDGDRLGVSAELEAIGHNMHRILELEKPQRGW